MKTKEKSNQEIIEVLSKIANDFDATNDNYLLTYSHFVNYFKNLETINLENLIIGISFTYSWMPTILKSIKLENQEEILINLNKVKNGYKMNESQLSTLKSAFNNSLVGTSKLLHFINPKQYAIWDSRVFRFINNEEPHKYKLEKPETYLKYLDFIEDIKNEKTFTNFYELMKHKVGFEITEYRAIELAFFKGK
jgi:hypothetical protein